MSTTLECFYFVRNTVCSIQNREKSINLFEVGSGYTFTSLPMKIKYIFNALYNDLENHYYTYDEVLMFIIYHYMFSDKIFSYLSLNRKSIKEVTELFNNDVYEKDKSFILDLCNRLNIKNKDKLFNVSEDGRCALYDLIMKKYISPMFFIRNCKSYLTSYQNSNILLEPNFDRFVFVTDMFINNYRRSSR